MPVTTTTKSANDPITVYFDSTGVDKSLYLDAVTGVTDSSMTITYSLPVTIPYTLNSSEKRKVNGSEIGIRPTSAIH